MTRGAWLRAAAYAVAAVTIGFAGLVSLTIGACDPSYDGAWCGGDAGKVAEGYGTGSVLTTLGLALVPRAFSRRWWPSLLAAGIGLVLCLWFVWKVELG